MGTSRNQRLIVIGAAICGFLVCYAGVFASLVDVWSKSPLYSYGFAVPFIAGYIAWSRLQDAPPVDEFPDYALGIPVTAAGVVMLLIGSLGAIDVLEQTSMVVTLTGMVLLLYGRAMARLQWFALTSLFLMVPLWSYPIGQLQEPSRLLSTHLAVAMLQLIGQPVLQQGTNIVLPSHTLAVLRECSGVNQLIAVIAMVLPAAYLWLETNARRVLIMVIAVTVSYLGNGVRIAFTGWLALKGLGTGHPEAIHLGEGMVISALGYILIGVGFSLLSSSPPVRSVSVGSGPGRQSGVRRTRRLALDLAILLALVSVGTARLSASGRDIPLQVELQTLDRRIDTWTFDPSHPPAIIGFPGIDDDFVGAYPTEAGERRFLDIDDELIRDYRNADGARVQLYVGYYRRQEAGKDLSIDLSHELAHAASPVTLKMGTDTIVLNEVIREHDGRRRGILFWYDINGRIVADVYSIKRHTLWDAITRRRTNGAVVMVAWQGADGASAARAQEEALAFVQKLIPELRGHLPS